MRKLQFQYDKVRHTQRAARTRTLIQLGGLLVKSKLVERFGIELGADLQQDETQKKKAYALLGLLLNQASISETMENLEKRGREAFDNISEDGEFPLTLEK
jgi:Conjugal transfer protein TraD